MKKLISRTFSGLGIAVLLACSTLKATASTPAPEKDGRLRVIVITDGEEDDKASMVRFLLSSNDFNVEAIVNTSSEFHWIGGKGWHALKPVTWVKDYIGLYAKVYDNLRLHDPRYPSPADLLERWKVGNINGVGEDSIRTEGAEFIARILLDHQDNRPIWVQCWGGCNTLSRALKIIQEDHPSEMGYVAKKLRLYLIWEQDGTYQSYIRPVWEKYQIPTIISDQFDCMAYIWNKVLPADVRPYFEKEWMTAHILEGKGALCDVYYNNKGAFNAEGDSPAFLHTIATGLRSLESPGYGGWGGRYVRVRNNVWMDPRPATDFTRPTGQWCFSNSWSKKMEHYTDSDSVAIRTHYFKPIWRWMKAMQNDFAARAAWCVKDYRSANHFPVVRLRHTPLDISAKPGQLLTLDASATYDPDNDKLQFNWWIYREAGTYKGHAAGTSSGFMSASQSNRGNSIIKYKVPADAVSSNTIHIICEVTDNGTPPLTRYRRVIIHVK